MNIRVIKAQVEPVHVEKENVAPAEPNNGKQQLIQELIAQYNSELETAMNYLAISENLKGMKNEIVREALAADVAVEMGHAKTIAARLHIMGVTVPCSLCFKAEQSYFKKELHDDVVQVIKGVIRAEKGAVARYKKIISLADGLKDWSTVDEMSPILTDEEGHLREFLDFYQEFKTAQSPTVGE